TEYSNTGALVIQEGVKSSGRPITLYGGKEGSWITRQTLLDLYALSEVSGQQLTLQLWSRTFNVTFRRPAIEAEPISRIADPSVTHNYAITINLMEVTP